MNIVDLSEVELPTDMVEFIDLGDTGIDKATDYIESNITGISPEDIAIKAPIQVPNKILAVGLITNMLRKLKILKIIIAMRLNFKNNFQISLINKTHQSMIRMVKYIDLMLPIGSTMRVSLGWLLVVM